MRHFQYPILALLLALACPESSRAELGGPQAEAVYGGRVNAIAAYAIDGTTSGLYVSTESANSIFYAEVDHGAGSCGVFSALPDADASAGLGSGVRRLAVHESSGRLFFILQDAGVYSITPEEGSLEEVVSGQPAALHIQEDLLFYLEAGQLHAGSLDEDGVYSEESWSPLIAPSHGSPNITLTSGPQAGDGEEYLYLFYAEQSSPLYVYDDPIGLLDSSTGYTAATTDGLADPTAWRCFAVAGDSRWILGGRSGVEPNHQKAIAVLESGSDTEWTAFKTGVGGTSSDNLAVGPGESGYTVYYGTSYSSTPEDSTSWQVFGNSGFETHPNDGATCVDPLDASVVYMTTDQGIGWSTDGGAAISEIDEGLEAVQVGDLEMDSAKDVAWLAAKSGLRKVTDYQSSPSWSTAIFPNGDGSPYYAIAMDTTDHSGDTAFAGNVRVYRTADGGSSWTQCLDAQQPPHNLHFFTRVAALEVDPFDSERIFAGYTSGTDEAKGALFYSEDGGGSFTRLDDSPIPSDGMNINDILFREEDGESVAYMGVDYRYSDSTATSNGIFRVGGNSSEGFDVSKDLNWAVHIFDLALDSEGGIIAVGSDLDDNPVAYYKGATDEDWTTLGGSGLPAGLPASAVTVGNNGSGTEVFYAACGTGIYTFDESSETWSEQSSYPEGTRINVLYYDELLVGTGTGLYGHAHTDTEVDEDVGQPTGIELFRSHPNPFNPTTQLSFELASSGPARLVVYNLAGAKVATLLDQHLPAGMHQLEWTAEGLPAGIYFCRLEHGGTERVLKVTLLK